MQPPAINLPECLRWTTDPDGRQDMVRALPQQLFAQLQRCLRSPEPPAPSAVWDAWNARPHALMSLPMMELSDDTMPTW
jgi:hypothetical protein